MTLVITQRAEALQKGIKNHAVHPQTWMTKVCDSLSFIHRRQARRTFS